MVTTSVSFSCLLDDGKDKLRAANFFLPAIEVNFLYFSKHFDVLPTNTILKLF